MATKTKTESGTDNVVHMPEAPPITKPGVFSIEKFRTKQAGGGVETQTGILPFHNIAHANDFARLSSHEHHWTPELCLVTVPVKGQKDGSVHIIFEDMANDYPLLRGRLKYCCIALASKPQDTFFLCNVPTRNLDNDWNRTNANACELAKTMWTAAVSRRQEGVDGYRIQHPRDHDAFREPKWPSESVEELIKVAFAGRSIDHHNHPGLLRLIGGKQELS